MILFVNYTGDSYHWGCYATSTAIYRRLARHDDVSIVSVKDIHHSRTPALDDIEAFATSAAYSEQNPTIAAKLDKASYVVVNGEGTLHGATSPGARGLLAAIAAAKHRGRPVFLINHSLFPNDFAPEEGTDFRAYASILSGLDWISSRESQSENLYKSVGIYCTDAFDCLPLLYKEKNPDLSHGHDKNAPIIVAGAANFSSATFRNMLRSIREVHRKRKLVFLHGSPGTNAPEDDIAARALAEDPHVEALECKSFDQFMQQIKQAGAIISGRFHYNIAALCTRTPLISFESNTPKNTAMLSDVGYTENVPSHEQTSSIEFEDLLSNILEKSNNFTPPVTLNEIAERAEQNFGFMGAILLTPRKPESLSSRVSRLFADGQVLEVIETYENAKPTESEALPLYLIIAIAKCYRSSKQFAAAVKLCKLAVDREPGNVSAWANLIMSLTAGGQTKDAFNTAEAAIARFPDQFGLLVPAACAAQDAGQFYLAVTLFKRILALKSNYVPAHLRLISIYNDVFQDFSASLRHARLAIEISPGDGHLQRLLGEQLLRQRNYEEGSLAFRRRLETPYFISSRDNRDNHIPLWTGDRIPGKLLVQSETLQGVGFELLCARMLPLLRARGIDFVYEASPKLISVLQQTYDGEIVPVSGAHSAQPDIVARANFTTLVGLLWRDVIRKPIRYSKIPDRSEMPLRIGISWSAGNAVTGAGRSIPLEQWGEFIKGVPGATWVNLQHGSVVQELDDFSARHGHKIEYTQSDFLDDNEALLDAIRSVDVVVSIDNSTVFYADTLQKPVFVIPPASPHWIWGTTGYRTPWVPNARILRRRMGVTAMDCLGLVGDRLME